MLAVTEEATTIETFDRVQEKECRVIIPQTPLPPTIRAGEDDKHFLLLYEVALLVHTPSITTLYDLIETLQDQVALADDAAVTAAVAHLCNAGYVKYLRAVSGQERD